MTKYSLPSNIMKSAPSCCQGCSGGGVGFSGCLGSWGWCLWQVVHASTCCSMSLLMPGQYTYCLALYWHLDVPKCPWWICSKTFFLSPEGTMIASPHRISPSSTVNESCCPWYGCNAFGTSLISSGYPAMIVSARALSSGSSLIASW